MVVQALYSSSCADSSRGPEVGDDAISPSRPKLNPGPDDRSGVASPPAGRSALPNGSSVHQQKLPKKAPAEEARERRKAKIAELSIQVTKALHEANERRHSRNADAAQLPLESATLKPSPGRAEAHIAGQPKTIVRAATSGCDVSPDTDYRQSSYIGAKSPSRSTLPPVHSRLVNAPDDRKPESKRSPTKLRSARGAIERWPPRKPVAQPL